MSGSIRRPALRGELQKRHVEQQPDAASPLQDVSAPGAQPWMGWDFPAACAALCHVRNVFFPRNSIRLSSPRLPVSLALAGVCVWGESALPAVPGAASTGDD